MRKKMVVLIIGILIGGAWLQAQEDKNPALQEEPVKISSDLQEKEDWDVIRESFPDHGVIVIAELSGTDGISIGSHRGSTFNFQIVEFLKKTVESKEEKNTEKERELLGYSEGKEIQVTYTYTEGSSRSNGKMYIMKHDRFKGLVKAGGKYIMILPSISSVSPGGTIERDGVRRDLFGAMHDDDNLIILEYNAENIGKLRQYPPERVKELIGQLTDKDKAKRETAGKELGQIHGLLQRELVNTDNSVRFESALILSEMGDSKAVLVLTENLDNKEPFNRYRAICALGKIKWWSLDIVEKLVGLLDDDNQYEEVSINLRYKISDASFDTLDKMITGKNFGKDKGKWREWLKQAKEKEAISPPPGG
ncbi:MAG: HEAT repeat domain-containing protein [Planctomycetes bacterium]|nr:HEAT repeat domain-containing protein [Planctomycetota bacterium]